MIAWETDNYALNNPVETVQEAVRYFVGDGEGVDELVLKKYDRVMYIRTLDTVIGILESQGTIPWNLNSQAIQTLRHLVAQAVREGENE